ncbi:MAG: hypothetical protein U9O87_04420, partial [Verrucomicrobiota bacterium]|nr:hypothetical protein [Verrucomicrobiota bacterium]
TAEAQEESLSQYHADKSEAGSSDDMGADEQAADVAQLVEEVTWGGSSLDIFTFFIGFLV